MQIYQKSQDLGVEKKHKAALILVQALFTAEIDTYKAFLAKVPGFLFLIYVALANLTCRWSPPRNIRKCCWVTSSASSGSLALSSSLPSQRFS
ncbi:hypothetical protein EDB19DRAFT_1718598 [Suillus lakei]|nr:hypothetical protein EDB19DRAFT_1718598 [Suillus lakei]